LEPDYVAKKVVEGIYRDYEHIYMPPLVSFAGTISKYVEYTASYYSNDLNL